MATPKSKSSAIASNKKAYHSYHVDEKFEAGISLTGTEVKSCREGNVSMADSYAKIYNNEIFLLNVNIAKYSHGNQFNHAPMRERKLLLHKREIQKLRIATEAKGMTVVPLKFYFTRGKVKVQLGLCRGKNVADKRQALKQKQDNRDAQRQMKNHR